MMVIKHWAVLNNGGIKTDRAVMPTVAPQQDFTTPEELSNLSGKIISPEDLYRAIHCSYPKFFKMDKLCKWTFLAAELLLQNGEAYKGMDKDKISLVLATSHGCLDVDKRYQESIDVPSPALFVYTLPNIMLGEICIRHGFKGEQLCMVTDKFDAEEIHFAAAGFLKNKNMDACLCGWADAWGDTYDITLFWVAKDGNGQAFNAAAMEKIYTM
jgi:hypothetical protein